MRRWLWAALFAALALPVRAADCTWPEWQRFRAALVSADGRVIDRSSPRLISTSEGQAYALFDPGRWEAVEVLRWLKEYVEEAQRQRV